MQIRCYMMILILSFSWLLSFQENHLCSDESSASVITAFDNTGPSNSFDVKHPPDADHQKEMCHFGHCSHAIGTADSGIVLPNRHKFTCHLFTYNSRQLTGISRPDFRPPAQT